MSVDQRSNPANRAATSGGEPASRRAGGNRNLLRLILVGLVLIGAALVVRISFVPERFPSVVAETAASASPEVAELLFEAESVVRQMAERYPQSADTHHVLAMLHARFGKQKEAVASWQRCLEIDPAFAEAHFQMGLIAHEKGDNATGSRHFARATEIDPSLSSYPVHWAKSLINEGKLEEAVKVLRSDLERHPSSVASLVILADSYLQLGRHARAKECYERVVRMAPDVTSAYYGLGTACSKLGETESARRYLNRFKELKAEDAQAHRDELKTEELGLKRVQESVAEILVAAAKGFLVQNDPQTAETMLKRAGQLAPSLGEPWRVLAWLYQRQERSEEAVEVLRDYTKVAPDDPLARVSLARQLIRVGRNDEAEAVLQEARRLAPHDPEMSARLAEFYLQNNPKPAKALPAARRAVELAPSPHHYFLLALSHHLAGETGPAMAAIGRAIGMAPDKAEYQELQAAIRSGRGAKQP